MTLDEKRWQQVNAYVDGELDAAAAADVAAAVANDRAMASAVAAISRLKAAAAEGLEAPAIALQAPRRTWRRAAVAASVMLAVGLLAGIALEPREPSGSLARLAERHAGWAAAEPVESGTGLAGVTLAGLAQLGFAAEIPDLSEAGLALAQVSMVRGEDAASGLHVRYIGSRGCRVSLFIDRGTGEAAARRQDIGSVRAVSWRVHEQRYALLASGMYEQRFVTIAAAAEAATRRDRPTVETLRQALRQDREQSPPCLG